MWLSVLKGRMADAASAPDKYHGYLRQASMQRIIAVCCCERADTKSAKSVSMRVFSACKCVLCGWKRGGVRRGASPELCMHQ